MLKNLLNKEKQKLQQPDRTYRIILSGGGTGGHIFPALAIANELKKRLPETEILFVGAEGKMEMEKVPKAGYDIIGLPITGLQRNLSFSNLMFPFRLIRSISKSRQIIKKFKPDIVIGTGGFASGPMLLAAQQKGIKTVIQEQNSFPGITNKRLGKKAKKIFVSYEGMQEYFPQNAVVNTGNPVRSELFKNLPDQKEAKEFFSLNADQPVILSVGGSLGSRTLNNVWKENYLRFDTDNAQLIWQTGSLEFDTISQAIHAQESIAIREFIYKMDMAYAAADVIVSRAGAIAISELAIIGKPMILVPFPYAAEDHQTKNAQALVHQDAAVMIPDDVAKNTLANTAILLLRNKQRCEILAKNTKKFAKPSATEHIVSEILKLLEK